MIRELPIKRLFRVVNGSTPGPDEQFWNGDVVWVTPEDLSRCGGALTTSRRMITDDGFRVCATTLVPPNSIVISTRAPIGSLAIAHVPLCTNQGCKSLVPAGAVESRYFFYQLIARTADLQALGQGSTFTELNGDSLASFKLLVPAYSEQRRIADFLDRKTAVIDELIVRKERLVALLAEKRQALITRAVTKGLDPDVAMKESGVEWTSSVPTHWAVERMRYVFDERNVAPEEDDGVVTAFRDGQVALRTRRRADGYTMADKEVGYQHVCRGDLVVHSMDAFAGAIGVSEDDGKCTPEYVVLRPKNERGSNEYFAALLRVMAHRGYIFVMCPSVRERAPRLRFFALRDMFVPVPPEKEQAEIAVELSGIIASFRPAIEALRASVDRLREYRQALITAAVTGKFDVPAASAQEDATLAQMESAP